MKKEGNLLQEGVYEKVISKKLAKDLVEALKDEKIWVEREDADPQEAPRYLSRYLGNIVKLCLEDMADTEDMSVEEMLADEVALINELVERLRMKIPHLEAGHEVEKERFLLRSIQYRANCVEKKKWELPETSLNKSFLFTGGTHDISIVSELIREIKTADRIDFFGIFYQKERAFGPYAVLAGIYSARGKTSGVVHHIYGRHRPIGHCGFVEIASYGSAYFLSSQIHEASCQVLYFP